MATGLKLLDAYIEVTADGKPAVKQVIDDVEGAAPQSTRAGASWGKRLVGGIVGSIAVAKIGSYLKDAVSGASDLNETVSASKAIYGDASAGLEAWASKAATRVGMSKGAALAATTAFGDMFTQIGFSTDAAAKNSKATVQMAADLGSFKNLETGDVLDRISGAMRGEYDSLRAVIPNISAARVENEALAASGKTSAADLTAQEKAQAVLSIVAKDGAVAMGDFAKTQDSLANQTKIATAQSEDLQAQLGTALLPIVGEVAGFLTANVIPALMIFAGWVKDNASWVVPLVAVLTVLVGVLWAVNIAMNANPIMLVITAIGLLVAAIVFLVMNWDSVVKFIVDIWQGWNDWIVSMSDDFYAWWNGLWAAVGDWIKSVWDGFTTWVRQSALNLYVGIRNVGASILAWWNGLWTSVGNFIRSVWTGFTNWVKQMFVNLLVGIQVVGASIRSWWNGLWNGIGSLIRNVWNGFVGWVKGIFSGLVGAFKTIGGGLKTWWNGLWNGLGTFVQTAFSNVKRFVAGAINGVIDAVNGAIGGINDLGRAASSITGGVISWSVSPLPRIGYARGTRSAVDTFIAGENGPEIVTGARGASVYTAADTRGMLASQGGGDTFEVTVVIDAKNVREFNDVVELVKALPQQARAGRGNRRAA